MFNFEKDYNITETDKEPEKKSSVVLTNRYTERENLKSLND